MSVYSVLLPRTTDTRRAELHAAFVRDGFSWPAFVFGPLWCIVGRLWLGLALYVAAIVVIAALAFVAHLSGGPVVALVLLVHLVLGLEAGALRASALRRRGWRPAGLVAERGRDAAERAFFARQRDVPAPVGARNAYQPTDTFGLFPEDDL